MKKLMLNHLPTLPFSTAEAINRLVVNVGFCGKEYKKIMVTSSVPGEGKSFVAFHLWKALAESGKKVVLVDGDIRRSHLRVTYQMKPQSGEFVGLSHYLSGRVEMEDAVYETNIPNAYIVPVVHSLSNPSILLQNGRLPELLDALAEEYDYVLVDTPPLISVSDGNLIASFCDGALLVIRCGVTQCRMIADSMGQLKQTGCPLMGTVLNREKREHHVYYGKKDQYSYYGKTGQ